MDKFGTCGLDDASMLANIIKNGDSALFSFSLDQVEAYVLSVSKISMKIGVMPFGGNPVGYYGVSVLYRGFYYFDLVGNGLDPGYVGEKLGLEKKAAHDITQILNSIGEQLKNDS